MSPRGARDEVRGARGLDALHALARDTDRGAAEIAADLLDWCEAWGDETRSDEAGPAAAEVAAGIARLARAQAAMAPLLRIANDLLLEIERREGADDPGAGRRAVGRSAVAWRRRLVAAGEAVALHLRRALEGAATIYTYSSSSTVRNAIEAHYAAGQWFRVVLSEGRPGGEGAALARSLAERGVPVRLGTDAWLSTAFEEEGVFVVGADAFLPSSWVNKTGTRVLAERARSAGIEVVVAADTSKWLPPALAALPRPFDRDPGEIVEDPPASMEVVNPYFEEIPYGALDRLVTERGPTRPRDLRAGEIQVAAALREP